MQPANHVLDFEAFKTRYQQVPVEEYPNRVLEAVPDPMVSVHISTYQHANFISDCIESVLMQQTKFPFEIIIGEDDSEDGTREICKKYAKQNPKQIRLFHHRRENNIAIHGQPTGRFQFVYSHFMARGPYIAICEGDDYWTDPLKLQKQVDFLETNPGYVLSHHDASIIDSNGAQLSASKLPKENKKEFSRKGLMKGPFLLTLSLCFRNVIESYPEGFFRAMNGDTFLISLLGQYGKAVYQETIKSALYRTHKDSMWSSVTKRNKAIPRLDSRIYMYTYYKDTPMSSTTAQAVIEAFLQVIRTTEIGRGLYSEMKRVVTAHQRLREAGLRNYKILKHTIIICISKLCK